MLYQPTYPQPYLKSIDVEDMNEFSVVINPRDIITKYNLTIYSEDNIEYNTKNKDSAEQYVYTTGEISLDEPVYGSLDNPTSIVVQIPSKSAMENASLFVNGSTYAWKITLYNGVDSITTPLYYFTTRNTPKTTLDIIDAEGRKFEDNEVVTSCQCDFSATFYQEQGETFLSYIFNLYSDDKLIATSGEKMESKIFYSYNGLMTNKKYVIELIFTMQDRQQLPSITREFDVKYDTLTTPIIPYVNANEEKGFVEVDYSQSIYVEGKSNMEAQYSQFKNKTDLTEYTVAQLADSQYIHYDEINQSKPLDISEGFTIYLHENFGDFFSGKIIELTDEETMQKYTVRYDTKKFYYKIPGMLEVAFDPYVNSNGEHQETSCVKPEGTSIKALDYDTLYVLFPDDEITSSSVILFNDITKNFWWHITLFPNKVEFKRGKRYDESVVS